MTGAITRDHVVRATVIHQVSKFVLKCDCVCANSSYVVDRGSRNELDDRRKAKDRGFKGRSGREFKNQNRNKSNEYENRSSGGYRSGSHSESRNQSHHQHDDEHVESISFTNSKLNSNSNRYSNVEYSGVGSNMGQMQGREYGISQMGQDQMVKCIKLKPISINFNCLRYLQQQPPKQSQQRYQIVANEMPILDVGNQISNQQNSQSTLLTTNHSMPISSSVIGKCAHFNCICIT